MTFKLFLENLGETVDALFTFGNPRWTASKYFWPKDVLIHYSPNNSRFHATPYLQPTFLDRICHPFRKPDPRSYSDKIYRLNDKDNAAVTTKLNLIYMFNLDCVMRKDNSGDFYLKPASCSKLKRAFMDFGLEEN